MFFLFDFTNQNLILGVVPESLGLLVFGVGLVLLTVGLRRFMKRSERNADSEVGEI